MGPFFCLRNFSPPLRQKTGSETGSNLERVNKNPWHGTGNVGRFSNNLQVTLRNLEKKRTQHLHLAHGFDPTKNDFRTWGVKWGYHHLIHPWKKMMCWKGKTNRFPRFVPFWKNCCSRSFFRWRLAKIFASLVWPSPQIRQLCWWTPSQFFSFHPPHGLLSSALYLGIVWGSAGPPPCWTDPELLPLKAIWNVCFWSRNHPWKNSPPLKGTIFGRKYIWTNHWFSQKKFVSFQGSFFLQKRSCRSFLSPGHWLLVASPPPPPWSS